MFSTQLRKYRLAAGLSQKELAGKLFVSQQAVARWETDKATPNPETVVKLAKIFGVTTDELLGKELVLDGEGNAKQNFRENLQAAFWGGEKDLTQEDLDAMWDSGNDLGLVVEQIYSHFNEFKLLLCCSAGTKYAWFLHDIVVMEQQETLAYMEEAKKHGVPVKEVDPKELHLLMTAYTNALFEVVVHDFTKEEALHYLDTMHQFFIPGWRAILGL